MNVATHVLSGADLAAARDAILDSPLLAGNQLGGRFSATRGFSIVAHASALAEVPAPLRAIAAGGDVYYFNALVMESGASVGTHVDTSLSRFVGERVVASRVAVLYVDVAADARGGELVVYANKRRAMVVEPEPGAVATFAGDLVHAVERYRGSTPRVSWVCEAYVLGPLAERVPRVTVESRGDYGQSRSALPASRCAATP